MFEGDSNKGPADEEEGRSGVAVREQVVEGEGPGPDLARAHTLCEFVHAETRGPNPHGATQQA